MIHKRFLRSDLLCRLALLAASWWTCTLAWLVPNSLTGRSFNSGGVSSQVILLGLTMVLILGVLDVFINDLMPDRFVAMTLERWRYYLYHMMASTYFLLAFATIGDALDMDDLISLGYLVNGFLSGWYALAVRLRGIHDDC